MSETIVLKWAFEDGPRMERDMQPGPVIAVAWQHALPTIWIAHDVNGPIGLRRFELIPTGVPFSGIGEHVGSAVSDLLVFHVWELT